MTFVGRTTLLASAALIAACVLVAGPARASGWTRWLGPNQDGTASAEGLFPDEFGLALAWSRVLGVG